MSCTRQCFNRNDPYYDHSDCNTCPGRDKSSTIDNQEDCSIGLHCMHSTGLVMNSFPPQVEMVCCHCGHKLNYKSNFGGFDCTKHGKYLPENNISGD
jgi:hypothetical protein